MLEPSQEHLLTNVFRIRFISYTGKGQPKNHIPILFNYLCKLFKQNG